MKYPLKSVPLQNKYVLFIQNMTLENDGSPYWLVFHFLLSVVHGLFLGIKIMGPS